MSKFIAEKTFRMTNENNDLVISYVVHGLEKDAALINLLNLESMTPKSRLQEENTSDEIKTVKSNGYIPEGQTSRMGERRRKVCGLRLLSKCNAKRSLHTSLPRWFGD